jgi:ubiquinone/menaquinone biosynthesis C-methylase UbiE
MDNLENRKKEEAQFHDLVRDENLEKEDKKEFEQRTSNRKFYSITRSSVSFIRDFITGNGKGKKVLDFCCGDGDFAIFLAESGADAYGVDISATSIDNAKRKAAQKGLDNAHFFVMDAENMTFEDDFFDIITANGVLHHLDIDKAYKQIQRVIKPDGKVICNEPLKYNPVFQLYRRITPKLRTEWETEHILKRKDIYLAKKYFKNSEMRFFHFFTLLAVPFRETKAFGLVLSLMESIDCLVLKIPGIKWLAWQVVYILSGPKK